jgi:hypothetical protein
MLNFLKKNRIKIYNILTDIVCVFGVILFNWNVLNILLFYWLDISLMILFVALILKKANKVKWNIGMLGGVFIMFGMLGAFYGFILFFGHTMGYEVEKGFLMAFEPNYMIPIFLCSSFLYNFKEYKFYEKKDSVAFYVDCAKNSYQ